MSTISKEKGRQIRAEGERERAGSYVSVLIHVMYHSRKQYRGTNLLWSHNHFILTTWLNKYLVHIFYGKYYNMKPSIPKHTCMYANIYRAIWTWCSRNSVFLFFHLNFHKKFKWPSTECELIHTRQKLSLALAPDPAFGLSYIRKNNYLRDQLSN